MSNQKTTKEAKEIEKEPENEEKKQKMEETEIDKKNTTSNQ